MSLFNLITKQNLILSWLFTYLMIVTTADAQNNINDVINQVSNNNLDLLAAAQWHQANSLSLKTGLTLPGPEAEYEYMRDGSPEKNYQHDFLVKQSFEMPMVYTRRKQLSQEQLTRSEQVLIRRRQEILHEARLVCISIVYQTKMNKQLEALVDNTTKILSATQKKMDTGDGNILDFNKAKLQLLEAENQLRNNSASLQRSVFELTALNGGKDVDVSQITYDAVDKLPEFEKLESEIEAVDPDLKMLEQNQVITQKQVQLAQSENWPTISVGYRYQGLPGQTFNGVHAGINIPIWENKNKVKYHKANLTHADTELKSHLNEHYYRIKQLYEKYIELRARTDGYESVFAGVKTPELLNKAFESGHLSHTEYFMELNFFQLSRQKYLEAERELHEVMAELTKHKL